MRSFYKKLTKFSFILLFALLIGFSFNKQTFAAVTTDPIQFYNTYGGGQLRFMENSFWFCQKGHSDRGSFPRYDIIGHEVIVNYNNANYILYAPVTPTGVTGRAPNSITEVHASSLEVYESGKWYMYDLWEIKLLDLFGALRQKYPNIDFAPLYRGEASFKIRLNSFIHMRSSNVPLATLSVHGGLTNNTPSHPVYNKYNTLEQFANYLGYSQSYLRQEWDELFNLGANIPGVQSKPLPDLSTTEIYVPDNDVDIYDYIHQPNKQLTYLKTGENLRLRFDARLSFAVPGYGMNALFWDALDFYKNHSGTLAMHSTLSTPSTDTNFFYRGGSFANNLSKTYTTNLTRHSPTLVTGNLNLRFDTEETYHLYPRVMTFFDDNYRTSDFQPRFDYNKYCDETKRMTVITDGTAPGYNSFEVMNPTNNSFDVVIKGVSDNASGIKEIVIGVTANGIQHKYPAVDQGNGNWKVTIPTKDFNDFKGEYELEFNSKDNVSNSKQEDLGKYTFGNGLTTTLVIKDHEYLAPDGTHWVQNNNPFSAHITADAAFLQTNCHIGLIAQTSYRMDANGGYSTYTPADLLIPNGMKDGQTSYTVQKGGLTPAGNDPLPSHKIDSKTSYIKRNTSKNFYGYVEQHFTEDLDMEYNALIRVQDNTGKIIEDTGYKNHKIKVKSDGDAPTGSNINSNYTVSNDTVSLKIGTLTDTRSGVDDKTVHALIYPKGDSSNAVKVPLTKGNSGFSAIVSLDSIKFESFGDIVVDYIAGDNVGNVGKVGTTTFTRTEPKPVSNSVVIKDYEYQDPNTGIKWVQVGNEFSIEQIGSGVPSKPSSLHVYLHSQDYTKHHASLKSTKKDNGIELNHNNGFTKVREFTMNNYTSLTNGVISNYYLTASSALNNNIYRLKHQAKFKTDIKEYASANNESSEYLGIDAVGPSIDYDKTGRNEITVTVKDNESGLNKIIVNLSDGTKNEINLNGNTQTVVIDLGNSNATTVIVKDNVGNSTSVSFKDIATRVESSIITQSVLTNGRKKLKVTVNAKVVNPVPKKTMTLRIKGIGDGVPANANGVVKDLYVSDSSPVKYEFYVDDVYNTPNGPALSYNGATVDTGVDIGTLNDITKNYTFTLESRYELIENSWKSENRTVGNFASGFDNFKYTLNRLSDTKFNPLSKPVEVAKNIKVKNNFVPTKYLPTGDYRITVTMYDYNGNPSGKSTLDFRHIQPAIYGQLDLNVTAVKDVDWKLADYPFDYKNDPSKFPLGSSFRFNNKPIKLGYTLNFNIALVDNIPIKNYEIKYDIYGKDASGNRVNLNLTLDGKDLSYYDNNESTNYLSQTDGFTIKNNKVYVKHYLPASMKATTLDGNPYTGEIFVDAEFAAHIDPAFSVGQLSGSYNLYSVVTSETALDDLELDKQR